MIMIVMMNVTITITTIIAIVKVLLSPLTILIQYGEGVQEDFFVYSNNFSSCPFRASSSRKRITKAREKGKRRMGESYGYSL